MEKIVKIGGASGYWGDAALATPQLLQHPGLNYLVYDYLAEITMSIMARARAKNPEAGYATDFVTAAMQPHLEDIAAKGVKVIANAGGVNPTQCAAALRGLIAARGLPLKVATVTGDDLTAEAERLAGGNIAEMYSGAPFPDPDSILSINAYLGGFPIAGALDRGADIVITGRAVDSAATLGALIHEFGWRPQDNDPLAGGSLAGHILECGPQTTGGNFTDWRLVADRIDEIGYPVAEIQSDGSFTCTKPAGTGGMVSVGTVSEQMMYEIGDPQAYILPDVICDFSGVTIEETGADRVTVRGARGRPAPAQYKVSTTYAEGFRGGTYMTFYGSDADDKANAFAAGAIKRAEKTLRAANLGPFTETSIEILGAESQFGAARRQFDAREVVLKLAAKHEHAKGIGILLKEMTGLGLATPPGLSGFAGARAKPSPVVRLFSFEIPKDELTLQVDIDGESTSFMEAPGDAQDLTAVPRPPLPQPDNSKIQAGETRIEVPLVTLAWARSGDKGNKANIGLIARDPAFVPYIWEAFDEERVARLFAHFLEGHVERFYLPGSHSINYLLHDVLGGGGVTSLRNDPQAKGYSQIMLAEKISLPKSLAPSIPQEAA